MADPGLPHSEPSQSYWQHVPHALANIRSPQLPTERDHVIIGSGISGLSVAKTLLENHPAATVTVFEARTLCSGATGRNGGQMAANIGEEYTHLADIHGPEMAGRIASFTFQNLEKMWKLIDEYDLKDTTEAQRLWKLRVFLTSNTYDEFRESISRLEADHPSMKGIYKMLDKESLKKDFGIHGAAGGAMLPAGTVWPYRLVTNVFAALMKKYPDRLTIETNTPVEVVEYNQSFPTPITSVFPYTIRTSRGPMRAGTVIHCTNGYTGHLLPSLRGRIHPFKGTMTVQDPGGVIPNQGTKVSWGFHYEPTYDPKSQRHGFGLYYLGQSAKTGYFYFGGENSRIDEAVSADDSFAEKYSVTHLQEVLPQFLGRNATSPWRLVSSWSGIMGFSSDGLPVVGRLPSTLTGRGGDGEWIAAAFNGYGMANCLLSGEVLALMILGIDVGDVLPGAYSISETRLLTTLTPPESIKALTSKL
ncbi:FAD dependent oxidoreductase [Penicillium macrosclerotiorum]|uniref:FAD dependent oxidoreductase n=1 Tax=Penicillium macrosclerotiorum TaxID=303699 RepID=UPI002546E022|nr:FAD dependent oxidoreductase [Penicillium macrosclerotiorum]KAJ5691786.1 FAD dependent oxidoreductase [Penicillium macrosclerotiorum]